MNCVARRFAKSKQMQVKVLELGGSNCGDKGFDGQHGSHLNFLDPQGNRFAVYAVN